VVVAAEVREEEDATEAGEDNQDNTLRKMRRQWNKKKATT
jgi:hypothetical protein